MYTTHKAVLSICACVFECVTLLLELYGGCQFRCVFRGHIVSTCEMLEGEFSSRKCVVVSGSVSSQ